MVEVRHCDRCGVRLPLGQAPDEACPQCGYVEPAPQPPPSASARGRRTPAGGHTSTRTHRVPAATHATPHSAGSNAAVFAVAAGAGTLVAVALGLLLVRGKKQAPAPNPTSPTAAAGPALAIPNRIAPASAVDIPPDPAPRVADIPSPAPVPAPVATGGGGDDDDDDYFAKIRAESEVRRKQLAEETARKRAESDGGMTREAERWSPGWSVRDSCGPSPGAEGFHSEHLGRRNVLQTHPLSGDVPACLERDVDVPTGRATLLVTATTHNSTGSEDWLLRAFVDDTPLGERVVGRPNDVAEWQTFRFDLSAYAGRRVRLRLQNASGGPKSAWDTEHGFWGEVRVVTE